MCKERGLDLIHLSSYEAVEPKRNVYAFSKWMSEAVVLFSHDKAMVVRLGWMFGGPKDHKFVQTVLKHIKEGKKLRVSGNTWGNPTYTKDAVKKILELKEATSIGTISVANAGSVTRCRYAISICEILGKNPDKCLKLDNDWRDDVPRVQYGQMAGNMRPYEEALREYLRDLGLSVVQEKVQEEEEK
jgi:dTDP-4-dehydrorhamnose reductase